MSMIIMEIYGVKIKNTLADGAQHQHWIFVDEIGVRRNGTFAFPSQNSLSTLTTPFGNIKRPPNQNWRSWLHPLGILKDLLIKIEGVNFKVTIIVLQMEGGNEEYSLLLGHPWLPEAKDHHD